MQYECCCVGISQWKWEELMKGARPANRRRVVKAAIQAGVITPEEGTRELKQPYYNPYNHFYTRTHLVYVNSAIEHFIRV